MRGKVGVGGLRRHYSEKARRGTVKGHYRKSSGKIIRYSLQQLSSAGLVGDLKFEESDHIHGKQLTKKGYTDMDRVASQIAKSNKKQPAAPKE